MKKVKVLVVSLLFCAVGYTGYSAHEKMTTSEAEEFMQANVEALTSNEVPDGASIITCLGLNSKECVTSGGDKSTAPLVRADF